MGSLVVIPNGSKTFSRTPGPKQQSSLALIQGLVYPAAQKTPSLAKCFQ